MNRLILATALAFLFSPSLLFAASTVTITPDSMTPGAELPHDFAGVSCETSMVLPNRFGDYYFTPKNAGLIALYKTLGIASLRIGGNSADDPNVDLPGPADVDQLYAFARAAGVKVIYTLRLKGQTDARNALPVAKYITDHYDDLTTCFA